jgi:CelD/BcsL family acetyltransferase involved in cellulose biosynthesis
MGVTISLETAPLRQEWDELADGVGAPPFVHPAWIEAWWSAFGKGRLELITARRDGRLAGCLPVAMRSGRARSVTNWHTPLFSFVAEDSEAARELAEQLFSKGVAAIELSLLDDEGPGVSECVDAATAAGYTVATSTMTRAPYVRVEGDFGDYERRLSKNRRKGLRRRRRQLEALGAVELECVEDGERLDDHLDAAYGVEAAGWKGSARTAIASRPETRRFYTEVAHSAAERGWFRLSFLRVGGRPVAFDYALVHDDRWYSLKSGFDPGYAKYAPGMLLLHAMLERAFAEGLASVELLGTDDPYKLEWADGARGRIRLQAFSRSPLGRLGRLAAHARPVASRAARALRR